MSQTRERKWHRWPRRAGTSRSLGRLQGVLRCTKKTPPPTLRDKTHSRWPHTCAFRPPPSRETYKSQVIGYYLGHIFIFLLCVYA